MMRRYHTAVCALEALISANKTHKPPQIGEIPKHLLCGSQAPN